MFLKNKYFFLQSMVLIALIGFSSCKKSFLDVQPPTSLLTPQALATEADLQVAVRGMYSGMRSSNLYGRNSIVFGDVMADVSYVSPQNSNRFVNQFNYAPTLTEGTGIWTTAYTVILRANNIINSNVTANVNVNQYKGEAYAARALMYFELIRFFAKPYTDDADGPGVPIVLTYDPNGLPARNKIREVYTQIVNDLNQAYGLMTLFTNSSYLSKYAAKGLLAKVYLTMGDYANAKTAALDVINNSGFTVVGTSNHASYWSNAVPRTDKLETLFEVSSDATSNAGTDALAYIYSQAGYGDLMAAHDLYSSYAAGDVRTAYLITKFRGGENAWTVEKYSNTNNASDKDDIKILRLSDVYLIAAEASYATNNEADARTYLNYVVTRRVPGFTGYTSTGAILLSDILNERKKELAFEGDRLHTLNRLKLPIQRGIDYPAAVRTIAYWDYRRILAIPLEEIQANPNIGQNDGYKQ
jgi:starch-binding outer membrane protein, SusD/RagB family